MADDRNPNDPHQWGKGAESGDPDATQLIKSAGSADDSADEPTTAIPPGLDQTQVLGVSPPAPGRMPTTQPTPVQPPAPKPQGFGGVYPAPPPLSPPAGPGSPPPRYVSPSPNQGGGYVPPQQPGPPQPAGRPPAGKKRRNWWVRGVLIVLALWLVFLVVVPIWTWNNISKVDAEPSGDRPADTAGTTYLLVGSDSREDLTPQERADLGTGNASGQRTDTIILLHVPDGDGPTLLLSIPRDSFVPIPGHGENKINAAYAFGGPELLVQTIEQATDLRVDDYVEVGFAGFVDIVDAVGGITVCPKEAIDDPKAGDLKIDKGCQDVDGHTALGYARSREFALGDITRAEHQREVISAVGSKAASWKTVVFPWRYLRVNMAAADTLHVGENVGPIDLARFAWAMAHTSGSDAKRCVVPYQDLGADTSAGSAVIWDDEAANTIFKAVRDDDTAIISCTADGQ